MPLPVQWETPIFWLLGCSWGTGSEEQPVGTLLSALHSGLVIPLQQRPQRVLGLPPRAPPLPCSEPSHNFVRAGLTCASREDLGRWCKADSGPTEVLIP